MIKQLDKGLHGIATLIHELRRREKDIIQNLEPVELNKKREKYRADLSRSICSLEHKKFTTPEMFTTKDSKKLETLKRAFNDVYKTVFISQYADEITMINNAIIFLDKAGQESIKLAEYYESTNKVN